MQIREGVKQKIDFLGDMSSISDHGGGGGGRPPSSII